MPMGTVGDRYLQPGIETMPRAELTRLQTERILGLVPYAYERSAFYRDVWDAAGVPPGDISDLDDFTRRIPTITRRRARAPCAARPARDRGQRGLRPVPMRGPGPARAARLTPGSDLVP